MQLKRVDDDMERADAETQDGSMGKYGCWAGEAAYYPAQHTGHRRRDRHRAQVDKPELRKLEGKQAASLTDLAPVARQSGKWQGRERIQGVRAALRQALYFPITAVAHFNADLKTKYEALIAAGKEKKGDNDHAKNHRDG